MSERERQVARLEEAIRWLSLGELTALAQEAEVKAVRRLQRDAQRGREAA